MSTYRFETLFAPRSVAVIGASPRERSLGRAVLTNLRQAGFGGAIHLVNSRYPEIDGLRSIASLDQLTVPPDVIIVTTPAPKVPSIIAEAAEKGTAAAIVISSGLGHGAGSIAEVCERSARAKGMRIVGPNCLGVMVPGAKFNATFASRMAQPGGLALLSQSGAVAAGMIEWASQESLGFSAVVSIGDQLDVDLGDLLDFFALDRATRATLLYIESIKDARKFMPRPRAAARIKPVVVIKAGRHAQGAKAAATHTGALAGSDAVYDAAFRRAGLLRVYDMRELFDAVETLSHIRHPVGNRLAILTNGGGVGVLAIDRLIDLGGVAAGLSDATIASLDKALPPNWSHSNPVDIAGDADSSRYVAALDALLTDSENDAVLVMNVQTALTPATEIAQSVADVIRASGQSSCIQSPFLQSGLERIDQ